MKKKGKFVYGFLILSLALILSAANAHATAISTSVAILKNISITGIEIEFEDQFSFSGADATTLSPFFSPGIDSADSGNVDGWVDTFALAQVTNTLPFPEALGVGLTSERLITAEGVFAMADGIITDASAFAEAGLFSEFVALQDGYLNVSANFVLLQFLSAGVAGDVAEGFASAGFFLENDDLGTDDNQSETFGISELLPNSVSFGDPNFIGFNFGTLTSSLYFNEEDFGFLDFQVLNTAHAMSEPIPEPATVALFGMGMVGLAGAAARRKFKKEKKQISNT